MTKLEFFEQRERIQRELKQLRDKAAAENRDLTEAEKANVEKLMREARELINKSTEEDLAAYKPVVRYDNADAILRDAKANRYDVKVVLSRDIMQTPALDGTGIIRVTEKEMLDPLREGLIWNQLGIPVQSGLAGTLRWPYHTKAVASWEDEASQLVDSKIDFAALTMNGKRLGVAIPVSRTELDDSEGVVERVVKQEMPMACQELINDAMLTLVGDVYDEAQEKAVSKTVRGPWAQSKVDASYNCEVVTLANAITRKNLLDMKAKVAASGIKLTHPVFVMNENTKATLMDTKVDQGSGRFVCEDDKIFGAPVLTSSRIPDGAIGFGDFSYQAAGFFGQTSMVIDPYTLARKFSTDFVLNMRFGTARLRKEAFVLGLTAAAKSALDAELAAAEGDGE